MNTSLKNVNFAKKCFFYLLLFYIIESSTKKYNTIIEFSIWIDVPKVLKNAQSASYYSKTAN